MEAPFDIKEIFSPEDQPIVGHLGKFIISFFQALLQIGHFQSGDAKTAAAKKGLFQEWGHLAQRDREVSFIIRNHESTSVVLVYGILSTITPIEKLFSPDMADLLTPKVCDFFNRRYLSGFSLKSGITFEEFDCFIEIMRAPINPVEIDQTILEITEKLTAQRIIHATMVYAQEIVVGSEPLHFMTQMALTRFEKELRIILLHSHLTQEQKIVLKGRVFQDMLVPLSDTAILQEILMNCHLINLSGWSEPIDLEAEIAKGIGPNLLWKFLLESINAGIAEADRSLDDRLVLIAQKIVSNLSLDKMKDESEEILEVLLREKIVTLLEIPQPVLDRIYLTRKTDDYLQNKERYWKAVQEGERDEQENGLIHILPVLLKRNEFLSFGELLDRLRRKWQCGTAGEGNVPYEEDSEFLAQVGMESMRGTILSKIRDRQIPNRKELFVMLEPFSLFLCKALLPLCTDEDIVLRRNICKILAGAGEKGVADLIAFGNDHVRNWQTLRNVVMMLGEIGSSEEPAFNFLKRCNLHPNPRVREEVVVSLGKMQGPHVATILLKDLENPDMMIRSRAVAALGNFHPVHERYRKFMEEALKRKRRNEPETDEQVQIHCCLAIEKIARIDLMAAQYFEPTLCNALTPNPSALFGLVREKYHEKGYEVKKAICQILGEIGTKSAFPLVGRLITEKYWHPEDRARIQQVLQKIERRVGIGE
ncbi:MAG: HEAT repeat domain-containing protein [Nitrospirae bacterium]|nr:HEAT repeat domain-containing protein [Candidatus Troglogloeales bacterium]